MDSTTNRREFTRVPVSLLAELRSGGSVDIAGTLVDVSLNGMFVTCAANLPVNTICEISLQLDAGGGMETIKTEGKVIRQDPAGLALQFTKILGPDSLAHLQNLVLYNSGDQITQVEKELSSHVGLKPSGTPA
jgi:PilZ domain